MSNLYGTQLWTNNASTTLGGALSPSSTTIDLAAGAGALFPNPAANQFFALTLNDAATGLIYEVVYATSRTTDTLVVVRGQDGTSAQTWAIGDIAFCAVNAGALNGVAQFTALQQQATNYAVDSGAVNAAVITLSPVPPSLSVLTGAPLRVLAAAANTGGVTLRVNGLSAAAVIDPSGSALSPGQYQGVVEVVYNGTAFVLISAGGRARVAGSSAQPFSVSNLTALTGVFGNQAVFTSSGTWTAPIGVTQVRTTVTGGGGGGGGGDSASCGACGGAGGTAIGIYTVIGGNNYNVTVGPAGAGSLSSGANGGTSSFAAFCSATGGAGGQGPPLSTRGGGGGGTISGATAGSIGGVGSDGSAVTTAYGFGLGGASYWGGGGRQGEGGGVPGAAVGSGGGGGYNGVSYGGAGGPGAVLLEW